MRSFKKLVLASFVLFVGGLGVTHIGMAATATANFTVKATVASNCTLSAGNIDFGTIDPTSQPTTNLTGSGTLTLTCTKGATTSIDLNPGANYTSPNRNMANGGDKLPYQLYQPTGTSGPNLTTCPTAGQGTVWGSGAGGSVFSPAAAPSKVARSISVCAYIPNADVPAAAYSDSITATVNF